MERSITIPAKVGNREGVLPVVVSGEVFACVAADAQFEVRPNTGDRISARKGSTWGNPGAKKFTSLTFYNTSAADIDVTFFAGSADNRPNTPLADGNVVVITDPAANTLVAPTEGIYVIVGAAVQAISASATESFQKLFLHPGKAVAAGVITPNGADILLGRSATYLPFTKVPADLDTPVFYEVPGGQRMLLSKIHIKGTAGDGVFYSYV